MKRCAIIAAPVWQLPPEKRKEVEQLRKELAKLGTDFDTNIVNAKAPLVFTKAELDGVPESFLESPGVKTGDDSLYRARKRDLALRHRRRERQE